MPEIFNISLPNKTRVAIWKISESEDFYLKNQQLSSASKKQLARLKGGRRMEWIASRFLIQHLLPKPYFIEKDKFGKPHLVPHDKHISISHSHGHVAAIVSPLDVGIDLQYKVSKITRIAHKFMNASEKSFATNRFYISNLHLIWGAKECLFKSYGRKKVDFKKDLMIDRFTYRKEGNFTGHIYKKNYTNSFTFANHFIKKFYLVYGYKND